MKIKDRVVLDNIEGCKNTFKTGANGCYTIRTGDKGVVVQIRNYGEYDVDVKMDNGKLLSFQRNELLVIN